MINQELFFQIFNLSHKSAILDKIMIFGAQYVIIFTYLLTVILAFRGSSKERKALPLIIFGVPLALILIQIIHLFFHESRPFIVFSIQALVKHGADNAFPSTHATMMSVVASAYAYYKSKWIWGAVLLFLWVGFSRIFVGVHYPLDILGGILTGFLAVSVVWYFKNWLRKKLSKPN